MFVCVSIEINFNILFLYHYILNSLISLWREMKLLIMILYFNVHQLLCTSNSFIFTKNHTKLNYIYIEEFISVVIYTCYSLIMINL